MTAPQRTERVVRDCAEAGVRRVRMHCGGGQGAVSKEAADFCHKNGIRLVEGYCPFMFFPTTSFFHRVHGFLLKLLGGYPADVQGAPAPVCISGASAQQRPGTNVEAIKRKAFWPTLIIVVALLVAVVAFVNYSYRQDLRAAQARVAFGSKLISTACGLIEYADIAAGTPVLVIHGAGGGFDQGLDFGRPLIDSGFRVIAPSRFGYLRTPLPADASPMAQADAYACLLDALKLDKVAVLGGSAGAPSAMQLCLRHPERCSAMVLGVPLAYSDRPAGASPAQPSAFRDFLIDMTLRSDFLFWTMSKLARDTTIKTILATPPGDVEKASADEQARVAQILDHIEPISQREKGLRNDVAIARSLPRYDLERFVVPMLVISVENDLFNTYSSARYTAEHIQGARFVGYPTGGHVWVGHQTELWPKVAKFLQNAAEERAQ